MYTLAATSSESCSEVGSLGGCGAITSALTAHPNDQDVQSRGLHAAAVLASNSSSNREKLIELGILDVVVKALKIFFSEREVLDLACECIVLLSEDIKDREALGALGACEAVLSVLHQYPDDADLLVRASYASFYLASGSQENSEKLIDGGLCEIIMSAMKAYPLDRDINYLGCSFISNLACASKESRVKFREGKAYESVLITMSNYNLDVEMQQRGLDAIVGLAWDQEIRASFVECGTWEVVMSTMEKYNKDCYVQTAGCGCISALSGESGSEDHPGGLRACRIVMDAVKSFKIDPDMVAEGLRAMAWLSSDMAENSIELSQLQGCELVVQCLETFPTNVEIQEMGCCVIACLCFDFPDNSKRLADAGACAAVISSMTAFSPPDREVMYDGLRALGRLAWSSAEVSKIASDAGACQIVVKGMDTFPEDLQLQCAGCRPIVSLAYHSAESAMQLRAAGADRALIRALHIHAGSIEMEWRSYCGLLCFNKKRWLGFWGHNLRSHPLLLRPVQGSVLGFGTFMGSLMQLWRSPR